MLPTAGLMQMVDPQTKTQRELYIGNCPGPRGRLSALGLIHRKSVLCGAFVWAHRALNRQKWRFPAPPGSADRVPLGQGETDTGFRGLT